MENKMIQKSFTAIAAGLCTGIYGIYVWKTSMRESIRGSLSSLCEKVTADLPIEADLARDAFSLSSVTSPFLIQGHTHPTAAALRSSATIFATRMAAFMGVDLYSVGMSKSDQRKDMRGSRQWFWAKDTHVENRNNSKCEDDLEYICDVDYYMDMPFLLAYRAKPTLLYTVVPEDASGTATDDTSFTFNENGELETLIAGGGKYVHKLWNYGYDSLIVKHRFAGILLSITTYAVERKQVGYSRQLILLTPIKRFTGLAAWIATWIISGPTLERFNPVVQGKEQSWIRFRVHNNNGTMYTTSKPLSHLCATIHAATDDAIAAVARLSTTNLMLPTTASWLEKDQRAMAAVLTEFHRDTMGKKIPTVFPVELGVRAYQYEPKSFDQDAKVKLQAFMSPLVHGAFCPVNNRASEQACVDGRIDGLKKPEPKPNPFVERCMKEFADFIIPGDTILEPVCVDVVINKQTGPAQKLSLSRALVWGSLLFAKLKCFVKAESYPDVKDPRNISQYNDADKLTMAQFAMSMASQMKQFKWYGPGKTPIEIAERVTEICADAQVVNISDYHRMDGTITYYIRRVERMIFMKAFKTHRTVVNELLKRNVDNKGYLPTGVAFDQESAQGSGCSATSLFQTIRAGFTAYLGFRHTRKPDGNCYSPCEAFEALGIHLGDDGLDADLDPSNHEWAAGRVGLILEVQTVERGHRGVNFLARYYSPAVWYGDPNSMCDVKRQLSKFHVTRRLPFGVTPEAKLVEKSMSYVATDGNTPVIGEFTQKVLTVSDYRPKTPLGVGSWWSKFEDSVQYPNRNVGEWMDAEFCVQFPEFDLTMFRNWLSSANTVAEILAPMLCTEIKTATPTRVDVVVDNAILPAKPSKSKEIVDKPRRTRSRKRRSPV